MALELKPLASIMLECRHLTISPTLQANTASSAGLNKAKQEQNSATI